MDAVHQWEMPVKRLPRHEAVDHTVVWNNTHLSYQQRLFGAVYCIEYSPSGRFMAATSANQSLLMKVPSTDGVIWNEQRARSTRSLRFRRDEKMVVQTVEGRVVVKSIETSFERQLMGHTRDVRDAVFLSTGICASGGDDNTVRTWDISTQDQLEQGTHKDYVRSMDVVSETAFVSGSYDHTVALWDTTAGLTNPTSRITCEAPVEQVISIENQGLGFIGIAAGDVVLVFDSRNLDKPLHSASFHTKTVAGIAYNAKHNLLATGGMDNRVRFVDFQKFEVIASKRLRAPVSSVAMHPRGTELAVGYHQGELDVHTFEALEGAAERKRKKQAVVLDINAPLPPSASHVEKQEHHVHATMTEIRRYLAIYKYHRALKTAFYSKSDDVIVSTLEELVRRCALRVALSGHNDRTIVHVLRFAVSKVDNPTTAAVALTVIDVIAEIYGPAAYSSKFFHKELMRAYERLGQTVEQCHNIQQSIGILDFITNAAGTTATEASQE